MGRKKNRKKKIVIIAGVVAVILVAGAGIWFFALRSHRGNAMAMDTAAAMSTEVTTGSISTTVVGTGTLQSDDGEAVQIPEGLTIEEVYVESGDIVSEGDVLATVDEASVLKALASVQEELEELDEEIEDTKDDTESEYITTSIAGRVKKIYAEEGDSVLSVMNEQGALLILSIDDKMAVTLEDVSGVSTGDDVTVTLSDGTEEDGTVESVSDGTCVVTLTDDGPEIGDTVTVTDEDGAEIGSGELYVHQPIEITGTAGTVAEIDVEENEEVSASETLFELEDLPASTEYQQLIAEREDLTERLQMLTQLYADNTIKAEFSGTVQSVNVTAEGSSDTSTTTATFTASASESDESYVQTAAAETESVFILTSTSTTKTTTGSTITSITDMDALFKELSEYLATPVTAAVPVAEITETDQYTGKITWTPEDSAFAAGTSYTAEIELTAKEGYQFVIEEETELTYPDAQETTWEIEEQCEENTLKLTIIFPATAETESETQADTGTSSSTGSTNSSTSSTDSNSNSGTSSTDSGTSSSDSGTSSSDSGSTSSTGSGLSAAGNTSQGSSSGSSKTGGGTSSSSQTASVSGSASSGSSASSLSGSSSSGSGSDTTSSSSSTSDDSEDTGMETAFTISTDENMLLSVSIDELDILSIEEGQSVTVTLDALEDEEFEGEITTIDHTASNSGGVTKYTAEVTIPKTESMLEGMNASATIIIESKEDILTLPADAIQERGNTSFVYTEQDEDGNLSGEVEIETGLSDGSTVEITSGLEEGQTVYYTVASSGDDSSEEGMSFDFSEMMGGGDMPSGGGDMPSGGGGDFNGGRGDFSGGGRSSQ